MRDRLDISVSGERMLLLNNAGMDILFGVVYLSGGRQPTRMPLLIDEEIAEVRQCVIPVQFGKRYGF